MDFVKTAFEYHDANTDKYEKFFNKVKFIKFNLIDGDMTHNSVVFYDKDKNEMFKSDIESLGCYAVRSDAWVWGWSIPIYKKNRTFISRKLLKYGLDHDIDSTKDKVGNIIRRQYLITSKFKVEHTFNLDMIIAMGSYLTKMPMIFPLVQYEESDALKEIVADGELINYEYNYMPSLKDKPALVLFYYLLNFDNLNPKYIQ